MFRKLLASVGIGGATVETILDAPVTELGQKLTGRMIIKGGSVDQDVTEVAAEIVTNVLVEVNDKEVKESRVVASTQLARGFKLGAGEQRDMGFAIDLPLHTPVALGRSHAPAWLRTRLDIPAAIDATDDDALVIRPAPVQLDALNAMQSLGFQLYKTDVEHRPRWKGGHGFVQEFEFRPVSRAGRRKLDEVELVFQPDDRGGFMLLVQVDRSANSFGGFLAEATGMDESWHRLELPGGLRGPGERAIADALSRLIA